MFFKLDFSYLLTMTNIARENGQFVVDLPNKDGEIP
jgi:hypothetical protein